MEMLTWIKDSYWKLSRPFVRLRYQIGKSLDTSAGTGVLWAVTLAIGLIGSIFSEDLTNLDNYRPVPGQPFAWVWLYFVFAYAAVRLVMLHREYVIGRQTEQVQSLRTSAGNIHVGLGRLQELLHTMPPDNFGEQLASSYPRLLALAEYSLTELDEPSNDGEHLEQDIQLMLEEIASLAAVFDETRDGTTFSVNLMLYYPYEGLNADDCERLRDQMLHFWCCSPGLEGLAGVLVGHPQLSVCVTSGEETGSACETDRPAFALPVIDHKDREARVLPGAPRAFTQQVVKLYHDVQELIDECDGCSVEVLPETAEAIRKYFSEHEEIRSFVSMPLPYVNEEGDIIVLGVINIDKPTPGILRSGKSRLTVGKDDSPDQQEGGGERPDRIQEQDMVAERFYQYMTPCLFVVSTLAAEFRKRRAIRDIP